jgi:multidrug efflux pump
LAPVGASKRFNLSRWAIDHGAFTAFLLVLLLAAGAFFLLRIGQKEDPDFTFRVMVVQVLWPGATVEEMQEQVVDKIERKPQETPGLDFVRSYTRSGFANIFVNLKGSMRGEAVKEAFYQARKKIGDIRQMPPDGVIGPFFNDEFGDTYISLYAITGQDFAYPELKTFAKTARDILLRVPGVAKVDLLGTQDERIFIEVSSAVLAERGLPLLGWTVHIRHHHIEPPLGSRLWYESGGMPFDDAMGDSQLLANLLLTHEAQGAVLGRLRTSSAPKIVELIERWPLYRGHFCRA